MKKKAERNAPLLIVPPNFDLTKPGVMILEYRHDDGCPAIRTQREDDCRPPCRPIVRFVRPFDKKGGAK